MKFSERLRRIARSALGRDGDEPTPGVAADIAARRAAAAESRAAAAAAAAEAPPLGDPDVPAQVYGRRSCPWCGRAVRLLQERDIEHQYVELDRDNAPLRARLIQETRQHTVPYIFVRGQFVGGYNALSELDRLGQLELRVLSAAEREARAGRGPRIEVAERPNNDEVPPAEREHLGDREP